jgi:hypothetical protein
LTSPSIPQVWQSESSFLFMPPWDPCSTFWWPRKLCVQVLREGDKSSHRLVDMASSRLVFCKPFGMHTELPWACPLDFAHLIHCFLKDILVLLVRCFCLTARLRVIWSSNPFINSNFHESFLECLINEVWSSITYDYSWDSTLWQDDFMLHPLQVHETNSLDIEDINMDIWSQWHYIPCINLFVPLTLAAALNKWLGIIIHGGPVETTLPHLSIGAESSIVTPIWWWMTTLKYLPWLKSWYASS